MLVSAVLSSASVVGAEIDAAAVRTAMSEEGRLPDDLARDSRSRPEAVIPLLHIEAGATVVDIFGSGGYYSELLAECSRRRAERSGYTTTMASKPGASTGYAIALISGILETSIVIRAAALTST